MPPPLPGQKGTGKKGRDRQSRSRNSTPSLVSHHPDSGGSTALLELPIASFQIDDEILEHTGGSISSSKELEALLERLNKLVAIVETRGSVCDRGMRMANELRKARVQEIENDRRDEERRERLKRDAAEEEERGRNKKASKMKKRKDASTAREERPLTHGAHGVAPQDGSHTERSAPLQDKKHARKISRERDNDSASSSLSPLPVALTPAASAMDLDRDDNAESSSDEHQPLPAPAYPAEQTFGPDPFSFPDPTVYEILPAWEGMTTDEKKELYSVAKFPSRTLEEYIPASPPDKDFSNAKPTNQVQANTFATHIEPFFRPLTEEDLTFLRERGDRVGPFSIARRGKRHYLEVWAEEDGALSADGPQPGRDKLPLNQARGDIESMTDLIGESDQISAGPMLARLLATMRPEHRAPAEEKTHGANGDVDTNPDGSDILSDPHDSQTLPPATFMADSNLDAWKKATHPKLDQQQVDERIKQELRHIGFLAADDEPDYDGHYDDEVAARLRSLQARLKEQSIINAARKARLMDIAKDRMAHQEYTHILEDLDAQTQTSYLKRTRTLGKSKKAKRPGGAGGGSNVAAGNTGMARPGLGDGVKNLMEKRSKWIDTVGSVLDEESIKVRRSKDPESSIFKPEDMAEYIRREKETWAQEVEDEE
ncbi:uncharacterized protein L3040_007387 [Drepanopeziza brunnea f. sp. 'multigermtubi']|uniref:uncharacterized protein n=1 Tax=Drepanopeziza brunnea f. sp. 'multigermtubi' TaxID=698441 RepID=UPI0023A1FBF1|nr:hypothetical protein L3040_007387 [Drepanopeziza brunnea f. sp. 'multigermtubi']